MILSVTLTGVTSFPPAGPPALASKIEQSRIQNVGRLWQLSVQKLKLTQKSGMLMMSLVQVHIHFAHV